MKLQTHFLSALLAFGLLSTANESVAAQLSPCGQPIPESQSREVQLLGITCSASSSVGYNRVYEPMSPEIESKWNELQASGSPDSREDRQKLRYVTAKMSGKLPVSVIESWSFIQTTYDRYSHCPMESYQDTCYEQLYETEYYEESYCAEYESSSSSSDSGYGGGYGGGSSSSDSGGYGGGYGGGSSSSDSGSYGGGYGGGSSSAGESSGSISDRYDSRGGSDDSFQGCARYSTRTSSRRVPAGQRAYACTKQRHSICPKDERVSTSRECVKRDVPYTVEYKHDPQWKPGFTTPNKPERDYYDILPNKFDLLPGESESGVLQVSTKQNATLLPSLKIDSKWNEYKVSVDSKSQLSCSKNAPMSVVIGIDTVGRIKNKAPNFLSLPVDEQGNKLEPLTFESITNGKGRPIKVKLQDRLRATYLAAARDSRLQNGDPKAASSQPVPFSIFGKKAAPSSQVAFWAQTEFRLQLFRKDRWKRWVRVTLPMKFNSDKGDILGDSVNISLEAQDGLDRFYRPAAPLDAILGGIYKKFGVELSPNVTYYLKVQSAVKGLPFYAMGCRGGDDVCDDKEPQDRYYSEPVVIEFKTEADTRSWFKRFLDFQEKFLIF